MFLVLFMILMGSMVSAGFFDWIKRTITGKASSNEPTNVSVTITGVNPVSILVFNESLTGSVVTPTSKDVVDIAFVVEITDPDGISDINVSGVTASFTNWVTTRSNSTACDAISGQNNESAKNFSCSVQMEYYDESMAWVINVTANDLGNQTWMSNETTNFTYAQLQSIEIDPTELNWPSLASGATNQVPDAGNITEINNTGNYNASGKIAVRGVDLYSGENFLGVGNFTIDIDSGVDACSGGITLLNDSDQTVTPVILEAGNISNNEAQESLYYCVPEVPISIPSGTYDTASAGSWAIKIV